MRHRFSVIIQLSPFSVESVSLPRVNSFELFLEVWGEVDGGVEVLPDEGVVLHVLDVVLLRHIAGGQVADAVHGHDPDILDSTEKILQRKG